MVGLSLLIGHMAGDYLLQNDWMAANKRRDSFICATHCVAYTLGVLLFCFWFLPWWSYPLIALTHFPVDRFGLARRLMDHAGQSAFASGPLSPWSIVVVDNTLHLIVLWAIGMLC